MRPAVSSGQPSVEEISCKQTFTPNVPGTKIYFLMASVAVGISRTGPLGGKQGYLPYPSGHSQPALASLGHLGVIRALYCPSSFKIILHWSYHDMNVQYVLC
jgi:hypothetical protein